MGRRTWIKIFSEKWLRGTIRQEKPEIRGVWIDILALAGDSAYGDKGIIGLAPNCGLTNNQICAILNITPKLWQEAINILIKTKRISINGTNEITVLNWKKYQSEYERQKIHRDPEFIKLREQIKKRDNYTCQNCEKTKYNLKVPLCIHHIDNNPHNNKEDNLITLCMSCHSHLIKKNFKAIIQQQSSTTKFKGEREGEREGEKNISTSIHKKKINFNFDKEIWENITDKNIDGWKKAYPACDINIEIIQMKEWLISNPEKKKIRYRKFITNWLSRSQDKGGTKYKKENWKPPCEE